VAQTGWHREAGPSAAGFSDLSNVSQPLEQALLSVLDRDLCRVDDPVEHAQEQAAAGKLRKLVGVPDAQRLHGAAQLAAGFNIAAPHLWIGDHWFHRSKCERQIGAS
jgi:hypothetical protein